MEWLGEVPKHWTVAPLKRLFAVVGGATPRSELAEYWDGDIFWATPADLGNGNALEITGTARRISAAGLRSCAATLAPAGAIIVSTRAPIGTIGLAGMPLCTNQGCRTLVATRPVISKYYAYLLSTMEAELNSLGRGSTFLELSGEDLGACHVPHPSLAEQQCIISFLDLETGKIDALISEQQRLVELLKEKHQALVSRAVSNTNALRTTRLGYLVDVLPGYAFPSTDYASDSRGVRLLRGTNVGVGRCRWDDTVYWTHEIDDALLFYALAPGDIVFGMDRPWISEGTRLARIVPDDLPALLVQRVARIRPRDGISSDYVWFVLASREFREYVEADLTGVSVPHISESQIGGFQVPVLSMPQQESLASSIGEGIRVVSQLSAEVERAIGLLQERRRALISAAVTGKIDVRGLMDARAT